LLSRIDRHRGERTFLDEVVPPDKECFGEPLDDTRRAFARVKQEARFALDSPVEEAGSEPSVPL
jgi:hypothetical protein